MIPGLVYRIEASIVMKRDPDEETIMAIDLVRTCQSMQVLPLPGGMLDQDSYFVYLLKTVLKADEKKAELEEARRKLRGR